MSNPTPQPTPTPGPVDVPASVRGPYAPPPGQAPAYAPAWTTASGTGLPAPAAPAASGSIERFSAPKRRTPLLLGLLAGIAVAAVLVATGIIKLPTPVAPAPTPTASATPTFTGRGTGFSMPNNADDQGSWEIVDQQWGSDGVDVHVRVYGRSGTVQFAFQAFPKGSSRGIDPTPGMSRKPELVTTTLEAGQVADGWLFLAVPRQEATFFITTPNGRLLSAQPLTP